MAQPRPVNLQILTIRFPVMAVVSILHRITGVLLFFGTGYLLYLMHLALGSGEGFSTAARMIQEPVHQVALWAILSVSGFHLAAGIRHLFMDFHVGDSLPFGRVCAWFTLVSAAALSCASAGYVWMQ